MKKNLPQRLKMGVLLIFFSLFASIGWAQGSETFNNMTAGATNYATRTWTGDNGETWTATAARTDQTINGKAITIRTGQLSATILGGIGDLTITTFLPFRDSSSSLSVLVNGIAVGTIPYSRSVQTTTISGINASGDVILILGNSNNNRVAIDDVIWTAPGNAGPVITNIVQVPDATEVTTSDTVLVSADITDDVAVASAELRWGTGSGDYTGTIPMTLDTGTSFSTTQAIQAQAVGTTVYYVIAATDGDVEPITTISQEKWYTVVAPVPVVTNITQDPSTVTTIDDVMITADIRSLGGALITSAKLKWGTASGNLTNEIDMHHYDGDTYISDTNIQAHADGTTVFYLIEAVNDLNYTTTSSEQSYTVTNPAPVIANIVQVPDTGITSTTHDIMVSADITDNNGIASAELRWGTASGTYNGGTITMSLDTGNNYSVDDFLQAQPDGTTVYYVVAATDTDANPATTISPEQSYTVTDPPVFGIPYSNGFRSTQDYNEAVGFGFLFNNAIHTTAASGYVKIEALGDNIVTPAIDFSAYNEITVSFSMTTYGGNTQQELSVLVSNDNGASYTTLGSYPTPDSYRTDTQVIDLSSLNGAEGRIKFEMTEGTNSIRFRDLVISGVAAFDGYVFNGTWSPEDPSGIATASDNIRVLSGIASLTENTTANNITINTGATLNIEKVLTIAGDITIDGDLVFVSSATGNGELAAVPSTSTITGQATVQSYMSNNRSYRMVSSSVTTSGSIHDNWQEGAISNIDNPNPGFGTHITGSRTDQHNGFDGTVTGNPSMFFVPFGSQQFQAIANTNQTNLNAGDPYLLFVRGDRSIDLGDNYSSSETTLRAKGTLHTGPTQQDFETADEGQFIMFGNPYQSAVDINSVLENNFWFNTNFYHVYDPNKATHGGYVTVNLPDGTNTDDSDANQYLQPGQGGQFVVTVPGAALISVTFDESDKAPGNFTATSAMGNRLSSDNMLTVQLYTTENFNNGGKTHDSFGIIFGDGFDNEVTHTDALKPMNFYENLGRDHNGTYLSIERREMPGDAEVYPLYSSGYNYTDYTLKMKIDGLDDSIFYLDDHFTQTSTLLDGRETTYNFTVDKNDPLSIDTGRFAIRTEARLDVNDNNMLAGIRLYPNPLNDNTFYINVPNLNGKQLDVNINDLSGRVIYKAALDCQNNMVVVPMKMDIASGIYLVTLNHGGESHTIRLIKE